MAGIGRSLEDARAWDALTGSGPSRGRSQDDPATRELDGGHLAHAQARVPGEPRWRLAELLRVRRTPRGVETPGWHEAAVKLAQPGSFTIRARRGYAVANPGPPS